MSRPASDGLSGLGWALAGLLFVLALLTLVGVGLPGVLHDLGRAAACQMVSCD